MVSPGYAWAPDNEAKVLERLRDAYEQQGFLFIVHPEADSLPAFLDRCRPDAIAMKDGQSVIVEVKSGQNSSSEQKIAEIRRRIAGQNGWKLNVVYASERPEDSIVIPVAHLEMLRQQVAEVTDLRAAGHLRAAFILSWSLLEAALNWLNGDAANHLRTPGQLVQSLAMGGYIGKTAERNLRGLSDLRNRIVHGDLDAEVSGEDVNQILVAIDEILVLEPKSVSSGSTTG
jgi:uncharacterized protein YutE (UPF0331/DUF86 family)